MSAGQGPYGLPEDPYAAGDADAIALQAAMESFKRAKFTDGQAFQLTQILHQARTIDKLRRQQ